MVFNVKLNSQNPFNNDFIAINRRGLCATQKGRKAKSQQQTTSRDLGSSFPSLFSFQKRAGYLPEIFVD